MRGSPLPFVCPSTCVGPGDWRTYRWERPLEPFPLPHWQLRVVETFALGPVSDNMSDRSEPRYCPQPRTRHHQKQSEACCMSPEFGQRHHGGTGSGSMIRNTPMCLVGGETLINLTFSSEQ
jgi:hypothetical protein